MTRGLHVHLEGFAFWSARLPSWEIARAVIRGERSAPEGAVSRPAPTLLAPTERRRAPDTVAVALEVASRACEAAGRSPVDLPSVFASTHGDLAISDYMCATLATTPALISPIKFHNSVHNAAAGYWSIGTGSVASYTAISAFHYTFATGLLEAAVQASCEQRPVLYVAFDIEAKGPMGAMAPSRGVLGIAMIIGAEATGRSRKLDLQVVTDETPDVTRARTAAFEFVRDNALAPSFPFAEAHAQEAGASIGFALSERSGLRATLAALA
jgi:hypothetical protein